jgi:hypothetical protein
LAPPHESCISCKRQAPQLQVRLLLLLLHSQRRSK